MAESKKTMCGTNWNLAGSGQLHMEFVLYNNIVFFRRLARR